MDKTSQKEAVESNKYAKYNKRVAFIVIAVSIAVSIIPMLLMFATKMPEGSSQASGKEPRIGDNMYIGARNCDKAIKQQLRDPDSYDRISTQIIDVKAGEGWVAETNFRARNGFGGYDSGTAHCLYDGNSYRAILQ